MKIVFYWIAAKIKELTTHMLPPGAVKLEIRNIHSRISNFQFQISNKKKDAIL
jgi:hypothetical protein